jgi:hypothetical protein
MRAGPLSRASVIQTLNRYFVPVYTSNEDYQENGPAPAEEKKEFSRIFRESAEKKLSTGTVHAYVLDPQGHPVDSQHVAQAAIKDNLQQMLDRAVQKFKPAPGEALVKPKTQSACPIPTDGDELVLHLTARAEGTNPSDTSWHAYPSEDWIVLEKSAWSKLLPPGDVKEGATWEIDRAAAEKVLTYFYPQTENNDVKKNRIDRIALKATAVSVQGGVVRARLDGSLRMNHPFYHKPAEDYVDATVVGYMNVEPAKGTVKAFKLVTDQATYQNRKFDAAVRSVQ